MSINQKKWAGKRRVEMDQVQSFSQGLLLGWLRREDPGTRLGPGSIFRFEFFLREHEHLDLSTDLIWPPF